MPEHDELIRSDGERLEVIPTPDSEEAETALNRVQPWWGRRLRLTSRSLVCWLLVAAFAGVIVGAVLISTRSVSQEAQRFFNATPRPQTTARPTATREPTARPRPTTAPISNVPIRLADISRREIFVQDCTNIDSRMQPIVFAATGEDPNVVVQSGIRPPRALYLTNANASDICYLYGFGSMDARAPRWSSTAAVTYTQARIGADGAGWGIYTLNIDGWSTPLVRREDYLLSVPIEDLDVRVQTGEIVYSDRGEIQFAYNPTLSGIHGSAPRWSPNGLQIAYLSNRQESRIGVNGDPWLSLLTLREGRWQSTDLVNYRVAEVPPSWSPDGSQVAFVDQAGDIWVISVQTRISRFLFRADLDIYAIDWLADGRIAFAALVDGRRGALFVTDMEGNIRQVTPRIMGLESFDWR